MAKLERKIGVLSDDDIKKYAARPVSGSRRARLGFIGAGWWATTNHMPMLKARRDVEMVSVCGLDPEVLRRCQRDFGFRHVTADYRELLRQDLDGVIVASPHAFHGEHALAALRAGCHVMVEKPFATSARAARAVVALAKRNRLHVVVPYGWNYRPIGIKAKELMDKHPVGKIEFVLCHMASPLKNLMSGKSFDFKAGAYVNANLSTSGRPPPVARRLRPGAALPCHRPDALAHRFAGEVGLCKDEQGRRAGGHVRLDLRPLRRRGGRHDFGRGDPAGGNSRHLPTRYPDLRLGWRGDCGHRPGPSLAPNSSRITSDDLPPPRRWRVPV